MEANLGDLGDDKERQENLKKMYTKTTTWWQDFLKSESTDDPAKWLNIQEVRVSNRLTSSPVSLVTSQWGYSAKMEKAYQAQGQDLSMSAPKTLEINADHPVICDIYKRVKENPTDPGDAAKETAELLTQAAIIHSGYRLEDASHITKSVHELLFRKRNVDVNAEEKEEKDDADDAEEAESEGLDEEED